MASEVQIAAALLGGGFLASGAIHLALYADSMGYLFAFVGIVILAGVARRTVLS